jgi:hypothetical protein
LQAARLLFARRRGVVVGRGQAEAIELRLSTV